MTDDSNILQVARHPLESFRHRLLFNKKPLGLTPSPFFPLELMDVLGFDGAFFIGFQKKHYIEGDRVCESFVCNYLRSFIDIVLSQGVGLVAITSGCDAMLSTSGTLRLVKPSVPILHLSLPTKVDNEDALSFVSNNIVSFLDKGAKLFGCNLGDIKYYSDVRQKVRNHIRWVFTMMNEGKVSSMFAYSNAIAGQIMSPEDFLSSVKDVPIEHFPVKPKIPCMITGSIFPSLQLIEDIESVGLQVMVDDTYAGYRMLSVCHQHTGDIHRDIALGIIKQLNRDPISVGNNRVKEIVEHVKRYQCKVAIFLRFRYCDPSAFETPLLASILRDNNVRCITIEIDREDGLSPREKTKLQTLAESI